MSTHSFAPAALIIATGNRHGTLIAELQSQGMQVFRDVQSVSTADVAARIELVVIDNPTTDALKASEQAANAAMDADIHAPILLTIPSALKLSNSAELTDTISGLGLVLADDNEAPRLLLARVRAEITARERHARLSYVYVIKGMPARNKPEMLFIHSGTRTVAGIPDLLNLRQEALPQHRFPETQFLALAHLLDGTLGQKEGSYAATKEGIWKDLWPRRTKFLSHKIDELIDRLQHRLGLRLFNVPEGRRSNFIIQPTKDGRYVLNPALEVQRFSTGHRFLTVPLVTGIITADFRAAGVVPTERRITAREGDVDQTERRARLIPTGSRERATEPKIRG